jgi:hypothetical protein
MDFIHQKINNPMTKEKHRQQGEMQQMVDDHYKTTKSE